MTGEGNEIEITVNVDKIDTDPIAGALGDVGRAAEDMGSSTDKAFTRARDSLGRFTKTLKEAEQGGSGGGSGGGNNSAPGFLQALTKGIGDASDAIDEFMKPFKALGDAFGDLDESLGGSLSNVWGMLAQAIMGLASVVPIAVGALLALGPVLLAVGGAAGAAATAVVGSVVAFATLKIGLGGVADAWTAYGQMANSAGASSVQAGKQAATAARAVQDAEYSLAQAKQAATQATKDLSKAMQDEQTRLINLSLSLRSAKFAEADAAQQVIDAENALMAARAYGAQEGIKAAEETLGKAQLSYDQQVENMRELNQQQAKATHDGVQGSDAVVAAKQRQADANEQVTRATQSLADAEQNAAAGGSAVATATNAFNQAMAKLAPNARDFVRELISVSGQFNVIKQQVQNEMFSGLSNSLRDLAEKWMPKLGPMLTNMASGFNILFKGFGSALGNPDFMKGVQTASKAFSDFLKSDLTPAVEHFIHGIGELAGGSTEPFKVIGGWIEKIAAAFDKWITSASKSGKLKDFMHEAADTLGTIWNIGVNVFSIIGKFLAILFPESKKKGGSTLDAINDALSSISTWLDDPKNQKQIQQIESDIFKWAGAFGQFMKGIDDAKPVLKLIFETMDGYFKQSAFEIHLMAAAFNNVMDAIKWIGNANANLWGGLWNGFKVTMNWIIDRWNSISFSLPSFLGGGTIGLGHISHFASGGAGGGLAEVGEHGRELIRLPYGSSVVPSSNTEQMLGQGRQASGGATMKVTVAANAERGLITELMRQLRMEIGNLYSGDVQRALGR